jgi:cobalt-precorrin-5B (C1)-methyltransferase
MEGGMAPDIRDKSDIHVSVSRVTDFRKVDSRAYMDVRYGNLFLYAGEGIGIAAVDAPPTRKGQANIEKDARKLIFDAVAGVCEISDGAQPLLIKVSCPEGIMIAAKQSNALSAFMGGIGIMGNYGTISDVHQRDIAGSIENQIREQIELGVKSILVSPGDYCADKIYEGIHLSLKTAVNCFNFPGSAIDAACDAGVENLLLVGNVGKLVKMAAGIMNTNSYASDGRREIFAAHTAIVGGTSSQVRTVMGCITCDEILALLNNWGLRDRVMASIMGKINEAVARRCNGRLKFGVALFSEEFGLLGATVDTRNVLIKVSQEQYALSLKLK